MKKSLLLILAAAMLPCTAMGANKAVQKIKSESYASSVGTLTEHRLGLPLEATGRDMNEAEGADYSVSAWIMPTEAIDGGALISFAPQVHMNANGNWAITSNPIGGLTLGGHGADAHGAAGCVFTKTFSGGVKFNEWNYVTVVVDNTNLQFTVYVNAEKVLDSRLTDKLYSPVSMQTADDGPSWFHLAGYGMSALIDEAHVFNTALSEEEVAQAYTDPSGIASLTGLYTFDEEGSETGHFANTAANAKENSDAVNWAWTGTYTWAWVGGTNAPASPVLVAGRGAEGEPTVVSSKDFTGLLTVKTGDDEPESQPNTVVTLDEMSDGTYTLTLADFSEMGDIVLPGITRDGNNLTGHISDFELLSGAIKADIDLAGTYDGTNLNLNLDINATDPIELKVLVTFVSGDAAIGSIEADNANAAVEYFNLQGVRVDADNLSNGIYVRRQGSKVTKVLVK